MLLKTERYILTKARDELLTERSRFLCTALYTATHPLRQEERVRAYNRLLMYVRASIAPFASLDSWQMYHGFYVNAQTTKNDRVAWINWILDETSVSDQTRTVRALANVIKAEQWR